MKETPALLESECETDTHLFAQFQCSIRPEIGNKNDCWCSKIRSKLTIINRGAFESFMCLDLQLILNLTHPPLFFSGGGGGGGQIFQNGKRTKRAYTPPPQQKTTTNH